MTPALNFKASYLTITMKTQRNQVKFRDFQTTETCYFASNNQIVFKKFQITKNLLMPILSKLS